MAWQPRSRRDVGAACNQPGSPKSGTRLPKAGPAAASRAPAIGCRSCPSMSSRRRSRSRHCRRRADRETRRKSSRPVARSPARPQQADRGNRKGTRQPPDPEPPLSGKPLGTIRPVFPCHARPPDPAAPPRRRGGQHPATRSRRPHAPLPEREQHGLVAEDECRERQALPLARAFADIGLGHPRFRVERNEPLRPFAGRNCARRVADRGVDRVVARIGARPRGQLARAASSGTRSRSKPGAGTISSTVRAFRVSVPVLSAQSMSVAAASCVAVSRVTNTPRRLGGGQACRTLLGSVLIQKQIGRRAGFGIRRPMTSAIGTTKRARRGPALPPPRSARRAG